jgi:hypothetical protein
MEPVLGPLAGHIPRAREVRSQRMCPFCGLITSRYKTCCLECGKSLNPNLVTHTLHPGVSSWFGEVLILAPTKAARRLGCG